MKQIEIAITKDSFAVIQNYPLFGSIMASLEKIFKEDFPTLGVTNDKGDWKIYIGTEFYKTLDTPEKTMALWLHEIMHVVLIHPMRLVGVTDKFVNVACDIIVNQILIDELNIPMRQMFPDACYYDKFDLKQMPDDTMEKVYERLKQQQPQQSQPQQQGQGQGQQEGQQQGQQQQEQEGNDPTNSGDGRGKLLGDHEGWKMQGKSNEEKEKLKQKMQQVINTAMSSNAGSLSAKLRDRIMSNLRPKVKWNKHLRIFGQSAVRHHPVFSHRRISRRLGFPFPGKLRRTGGHVVIGLDVSGSVRTEYKEQFLAECNKIAEYCHLTVHTFDTEIKETFHTWRKGMNIADTCGGTNPQCVFDAARKSRNKVNKVIILTDGEFYNNIDTRGIKTMFVITPNGTKRDEGTSIFMSE